MSQIEMVQHRKEWGKTCNRIISPCIMRPTEPNTQSQKQRHCDNQERKFARWQILRSQIRTQDRLILLEEFRSQWMVVLFETWMYEKVVCTRSIFQILLVSQNRHEIVVCHITTLCKCWKCVSRVTYVLIRLYAKPIYPLQ